MANYTYGINSAYGYSAIGARTLAHILYNMDTFNVDTSSLRTIDNIGTGRSVSDGDMYASNHIDLGATQSVAYDIPHTLGSEEITNGTFDTGITGWVDDALDWTWESTNKTALFTFNGSNFRNITYALTGLTAGAYYIIPFEIKNISGGQLQYSDTFSTCFSGGDTTYHTANGEYYNIVECISASGDLVFRAGGTLLGDTVELDNISIKQITNENSFLTYFDVATKSHVTVDNSSNTPSKTYTFTEGQDHSNVFTTNVVVIDADREYIDANPESIAQLVDGETVSGLTFDLTDIYRWYPCCEGLLVGNSVVYDEILGGFATIANAIDSCKTTLENTNYGLSKLRINQNVTTGRFTGMADAGTIVGGADGRNININMDTPYNHLVTKDIDKIEGTNLSSTITFTDVTTLVVS